MQKADSSFRITLKVTRVPDLSKSKFKDAKEVLTFSETEFGELVNKFKENLKSSALSVNEATGSEVFKKHYSVKESAKLQIANSTIGFAVDYKSGRFFVAESAVGKTNLKVYDSDTFEYITSHQISGIVKSFDADNGYLAYSLGGRLDPYVTVLDAETFKLVRKFDYSQYLHIYSGSLEHMNNVFIDGDTLFCTSSDQHCECFVSDITNGEIKKLSNTVYQPAAAFNREEHLICLVETGVSRTDMYLVDSLSGNNVKTVTVANNYNNNAPYFNGTAFYIMGKYYMIDGKTVYASQPLQIDLIIANCPTIALFTAVTICIQPLKLTVPTTFIFSIPRTA